MRSKRGRIDDSPLGPVQRVEPGEPPYPETMNHGAVEEIAALEPAAVVAKGDLTMDGMDEEFAAFEACYRGAFGDRLHVVRGNHDAYRGQDSYAGDEVVDLPGVRLALLDTVIPTATTGRVTPEQLAWLDTVAAEADRPVIVMGHHQNWVGGASGTQTAGLLRDQPRRFGRAGGRRGPAAAHRRATPPATPTATGSAASPAPASCPSSRWPA